MSEARLKCLGCGWQLATVDGYCLGCVPHPEDFEDDVERACTHCGGEGLCSAGADPLGNCPDDFHDCHACNGSGNREDQVIF